MNDDSVLGGTFGQLGGVIKQTVGQTVKIPQDIVEGVGEQVSVKTEPVPQDNKAPQGDQSLNSSDKSTREVVEGIYGKSNNVKQKISDKDKKDVKGQPEFEKMMANKTPEERKELLKLHLQLHKMYADPLLNPPPKKPEERHAEKVEKEKKQEMMDLQKKEEKKPPPLVQRQRERVEKFPGASG